MPLQRSETAQDGFELKNEDFGALLQLLSCKAKPDLPEQALPFSEDAGVA